MALTTSEYQQAQFVSGETTYNLADEVLAHLVELALAEQREHEKQTGQRAQQPSRPRPAWKEEVVPDA